MNGWLLAIVIGFTVLMALLGFCALAMASIQSELEEERQRAIRRVVKWAAAYVTARETGNDTDAAVALRMVHMAIDGAKALGVSVKVLKAAAMDEPEEEVAA